MIRNCEGWPDGLREDSFSELNIRFPYKPCHDAKKRSSREFVEPVVVAEMLP
jgi:hypothetical protein